MNTLTRYVRIVAILAITFACPHLARAVNKTWSFFSSTPTALSIPSGTASNVMVIETATNGSGASARYAGPAVITATVSPAEPTISVSFNPPTLTFPSSNAGLTSTATVATASITPSGTYVVSFVINTNPATSGVTPVTNTFTLSVGSVFVPQKIWTPGGTDTNWSTSGNWTAPGAPVTSNDLVFVDAGAVLTAGQVDNVVDSSQTIGSLNYRQTNNFHTTLIKPGLSLTVGATANGFSVGTGNDAGAGVTPGIAITGATGILNATNQTLVMSVLQSHVTSGDAISTAQATLDLSGLGTFNATPSRIAVGVDLTSSLKGASGILDLARTNIITFTAGSTAPQLDVGDNSQSQASPGEASTLRLGQTNALFCDSIVVGRGKCDSATPSMIFNGTFTSPTAYFRGTNGTPRVSSWVIGDGFGGHSSTAFAYGTCDFTGGSVDALVDTLVVGRGSSPSISGANIPGTGTLTLAAGNMDINTLQVGYTTTVGNGTGTVNLNGGNLLVNSSLEFAHTGGSGTLNISAGTAILNAGAVSGGGTSAINMTGGTLVATNSAMPVGTVVSPIGTVVVANGTLNLAARNLGATVEAGTLNGGGLMNTINISSVPTLTNLPTQLPVIQYTTPAGDLTTFVIGTMPGTFKGYISNNTANSTIDLVITNGPVFPVMVWDGAHSADWDTSTPNWKTNGIAADYSQNYPVVLFDDSLTGSTNVNLTTALTPGSLLANNSLSNYVFTGAGSLGGSLTLVKSGTGALTLAETGGDNFSGGLVINNGTLILDNANGNMSGGTTINNSGILQVGKNDANGSLPSGGIALGGQLTINRFSSLTVSNTISGSGTILQTGSGVTTLTGNNTFSGPVVINQGTLQVGSTNGIGTTTSVTASNGTFDVNGFTLFGNGNTGLNVNVAGSGAGGAGAIVNSGASQTRVLHSVTLLGDATFGGNGDWDIRNSAGNSASADAQLVGAFNLTKVGTNSVQLRGVTVDTGLSNIIVQAGTFTVTATASAPQNSLGDPNGLITVQTNAQLTLDSIGTIPTKDIVLTNGGTFKSSGTNTFNSQLTTTGAANNIISVNTGAQLTVTTPIVGPGGISKNGSSTLFLNAANTYIGTTVVSGGTLALYGGGFDGSIASSTNINVTSGATLDVSGRSDQMLTVANGQTLSGGVGTNGPGVINGIVIVPAAAILAPGGTTNTGVLSISSNLTLNGSTVMKLNAQAGTNDQVSAANISYGGTLTVTNVAGTLAAGNSFQLFIATNNYSNAFTVTNLPTLAAGLSWSNSLALDGKVTVVSSAPPPQPYITSVSFVGTTLIINGTNGTSGQQFEVFASTNLSVALSNWTSISTNTFTGNSFSVTNTISPTPPRSFFIIRLP